MKRDVDCMELTWACARVYPHFKEAVYSSRVYSNEATAQHSS
jgi:hypothetical protein